MEGLEGRPDVRVYLKLPRWFTVTTPVGEYNPHWAIVMEDRDAHGDVSGEVLYLVRETKSTLDPQKLRQDGARKIGCAARPSNERFRVSNGQRRPRKWLEAYSSTGTPDERGREPTATP